MDQLRYVVAVLIVTVLPAGLVWWLAIHPFVGYWRRIGARTSLTVMTLASLGGVAGLMLVRDVLVVRDLGTQPALLAMAALLFALSAWIASKRRRFLTLRIMAGVPELEGGGTVLEEGIYGVIRHPRYVELFLGTLAYSVFSNHVGAYAVAVAAVPSIHLIVLLEERELVSRFGQEYEEYQQRVPRYFPRW